MCDLIDAGSGLATEIVNQLGRSLCTPVHRSGLPHIIVQPRKSVQDTCADGDKIAGLTPEAKFAAALKDASCPLAGYVLAISNAFGFVLDDTSLRRAVVEGVPETVIAAIYLLHERSVGEVAAKLTPDELEHVIRLVGRCPSCYPPGTLDALKSKRMALLTPTAGSLLSSGTAKRRAQPRHQHRRPSPRPEVTQGTAERPRRPNAAPKPTGFRGPPAREANGKAEKSGTLTGTAAETARRRLLVQDLMGAGLSVRMISGVTDIPPSSVHRATMAIVKAEAKKELAVAEITSELLGRKLSHRRRA